MEGASPNSTTLFARSRRVQWSWPGGASLHARAIRCASPRSSSLVGCPGRGSSSKARFSPPSRYRRLVRHTVPADVSSASTMRITPQPVSAFSRIRARATFRARLFPPANQSFQLVSFFPFQPDHIPFSSHGCHPPTSTLLKKGSNLRRFLKQLPKPS